MAIDISKLGIGTQRPVQNQPKAQAAPQPQGSATTTKQDAVVLTEQAQQLQKAETIAQASSGVDHAKVAELKAAIAEGRYHVDPEKLAANLSKFEAELNG